MAWKDYVILLHCAPSFFPRKHHSSSPEIYFPSEVVSCPCTFLKSKSEAKSADCKRRQEPACPPETSPFVGGFLLWGLHPTALLKLCCCLWQMNRTRAPCEGVCAHLGLTAAARGERSQCTEGPCRQRVFKHTTTPHPTQTSFSHTQYK